MTAARSNFKDWLRKADNDLIACQRIAVGEFVPWDVVCFHAQQAAEKLLKAVLVFAGSLPPRSHDLVFLLSSCIALRPELSKIELECQALTPFAVESRYPGDFDDPTESMARDAIAAAHRIRATVVSILAPDKEFPLDA